MIVLSRALPVPDLAASDQHENFDAGAERVVDRCRANHVDPAALRFDDHISCIADEIDIVARATFQRIGARAAVERVVAGIAGDPVGESVARAGARAARQHEVLDIGPPSV